MNCMWRLTELLLCKGVRFTERVGILTLREVGTMASDAVGNAVWSHVRTTASNTIGLAHLVELLDSAPKDASLSDYTELVVDENLLGRETGAGLSLIHI